MSNVTSIHHIVINTKHRKMTIPEASKRELYRYIYGIITNHGCKLLRLNGIGNHLHILLDMHPTVALADLVKYIKRSSNLWMSRQSMFPDFEGWGKEYFAVSVSRADAPTVIEYIKNQEIHHGSESFEDEFRQLHERERMEWHDYMLT